MSTDKKRSKAQISRIIQLDRSFGSFLAYLGKKALKNVVFSLPRDSVPVLASRLTSNTINKFERKISGKGAVGAGKGFYFICFKWRYD